MNFVRKHVFILGRVQGVGFRQETRLRAKWLGLKGFVKNLEGGKVEIVIEGSQEKADKLLRWIKRGPVLAKVKNLEIIDEEYKKEFKNFKIIY